MSGSATVRFYEVSSTVDEYCRLRVLSGLSAKVKEAAEISLPRTVFGISGYHGSELVAMGRIVGDGACHIQLCDIAVHPRLQRQGLGREVMLRLTAWLDQNLPPSSEVTLIAKGTSNLLYKQHGFVSTAPIAVSMCRRC